MSSVIGFVLLSAMAPRQQDLPGIRLVEAKVKTNIFAIKIAPPLSVEQGQALDDALLRRQGIWSAQTDAATRTCTLEALHVLQPQHLAQVIEQAGHRVSKSFQE